MRIIASLLAVLSIIGYSALALTEQKLNGALDELGSCTASYDAMNDRFQSCRERLETAESGILQAIDRATEYCRG